MRQTKRVQRKLSSGSSADQRVTVTQMTRNQAVVGLAEGIISNLMDRKDLYRENVKKAAGRCRDFINRFNADMSHISVSEAARDLMYDAACEFQRLIDRDMFFYRQALKRALDENHINESELVTNIELARSLISVSAYAGGIEARHSAYCVDLTRCGGARAIPVMSPDGKDCEPHSLAVLQNLIENLIQEICAVINVPFPLRIEMHKEETERAMAISGKHLQENITNYEFCECLYCDGGHTMEEALELMEQHKRDEQSKEERKILKAAKAEANSAKQKKEKKPKKAKKPKVNDSSKEVVANKPVSLSTPVIEARIRHDMGAAILQPLLAQGVGIERAMGAASAVCDAFKHYHSQGISPDLDQLTEYIHKRCFYISDRQFIHDVLSNSNYHYV